MVYQHPTLILLTPVVTHCGWSGFHRTRLPVELVLRGGGGARVAGHVQLGAVERRHDAALGHHRRRQLGHAKGRRVVAAARGAAVAAGSWSCRADHAACVAEPFYAAFVA